MTEVLKGKSFEWTDQAHSAFEEIKRRLTCAPILALPSFSKILEVESDASGVNVLVVLSREKRPTAFFSEKLNVAKRKYSTYDKELYADGDHPIQPMETQTSVQNPAKGSSIVKEVQMLLKNWLHHPGNEVGSSPGN